jgi:outer membrane protein assembly factor BamB
MFHVKQHRGLGLLLLFGLLGILVAGCVGRVGTRGWAGPVKNGNTLIVSTGGSRIDGIGPDGRRIWRFPELWNPSEKNADDLDGVYGVPVISADGRVVFVGDHNGFVYAFRPGDYVPGQTQEQPGAGAYKLDGPVIGGILLDSAKDVLYATAGGNVYSLRASNLVELIQNPDAEVIASRLFTGEEEIWSTPVLADGKLLFDSVDGYLTALDPVTGEVIWRFKAKDGLVTTPTIVGNSVLVAGFGSTLYSVDLEDGSEQWSFVVKHWIWGEPLVTSGTAYFGDFDGVLHAVTVSDGSEDWSISLDKGPIRGSPVLAAGTLIVGTDQGWLIGIDQNSQEIVWQRDVGTHLNADMLVDGSNVYIAPQGCVTPEGGGDNVYYIQVNPTNGDLTAATGIC